MPRKPPEEVKGDRIYVVLTKDLKDLATARAQELGLPTTGYLRFLIKRDLKAANATAAAK